MSELPPYIRDADQSPPPPPEAVTGQAGRAAVSPPQESALPLSGGGAPPIPQPQLGPNVVRQPGHIPYVQPYEPPPGAGGDQPAPTRALATPSSPSGIPVGPITQADYDRIAPRPAAPPAQGTLTPPDRGDYGGGNDPPPAAALPVTPGPGGTAAVQSPEPAKTQATPPPKQPAPEDKPLATTPGAAALPQPEVSSAPFKGTIPVSGFNWLANKQPEVFNTIAGIGQRFGVSTERLIQHARMESELNLNVSDGAAGEQGPFQILPKTQKYLQDKYLRGQQLDPKTWEGGATLAALKVRECDQRGADSYASVACYNGGGEGAKEYAAKFFSDKKSSDHSSMNFGDLEKPNGGSTMTANGVVKAFRSGPDAGMRYLVDTSSRGSSMSDAWQQAQSSLLEHFVGKGDMDGAEKAQDFIMRQAFMGSNTHLMGAAASLERGDGMMAAQQLAKAHAFFPDGTAGRFMTNGREVFGVRLDETTSKPMGQPFNISAQDVRAQLRVTGNPMTFAKFLTDQQKAAAEIRLHNAQAGYQEARPAIELLKEQGRSTRLGSTQAAAEQLTHLRNMYADRRQLEALNAAAASKAGEKDPETAAQLDKFMADNFAPGTWEVPAGIKPESQAAFIGKRNQLARGLKANSPKMSMDPGLVKDVADKVMNGAYTLIPSVDQNNIANNGFFVADGKTLQRIPGDIVLDTPTGELLTGKTHPARRPPPQQQGGVANSASASGAAQDGSATGASLARYTDPSSNARLGGRSSVEGVGSALTQRIHTLYAAMPPEIQRRFGIISGYRDAARQREVNPKVTHSQHGSGTGPAGTGRAVDLRDDPVVLNWIHQNGPRVAGVGFPLWNDPKERNHLEMVDPHGRRLS